MAFVRMVKTASLPDAIYQEGKVYDIRDKKLLGELVKDGACEVVQNFTPPKALKKRERLMPSTVPDPLGVEKPKNTPSSTSEKEDDWEDDEDEEEEDK